MLLLRAAVTATTATAAAAVCVESSDSGTNGFEICCMDGGRPAVRPHTEAERQKLCSGSTVGGGGRENSKSPVCLTHEFGSWCFLKLEFERLVIAPRKTWLLDFAI